MNYEFEQCKTCGCTKPFCGTCPYRYCRTKEDYDFVTQMCEDLRNHKITDRQFKFRYKKRFNRFDC